MLGINKGHYGGGLFKDDVTTGIDDKGNRYIYNKSSGKMLHYGKHNTAEGGRAWGLLQDDVRNGRINLIDEGNRYRPSGNNEIINQGGQTVPTSGGGSSGGGGGGYYDPQAAQRARDKANEITAYREVENEARDALGRLGKKREVGLNNINQNYAEQMNQLENDYTQNKGIYDLNTQDAIARNRTARERIAEQAGLKSEALRKMFAAHGAGDSSAAQIIAPYKVSLDASRQMGEQHDEYARNRRSLDMEFANMSNVYNRNRKKLDAEKQNQINNLDQEIEGTRIGLNNKIRDAQQKAQTASGVSLASAIAGTAGLKNEIRASEDRILDLGKKTPVALDKIAFNTPKLESYADNIQGGKIDTGNPDQSALTDQLDPRLANLLDPNRKKKDLEEA